MKNTLVLSILLFITFIAINSGSSLEQSQMINSGDSAVCMVSDEIITGEGVKLSYLGKEYVFCCEGCVSEFKAASIKYTDGKAICPICNHDDGKESITTVYNETTYYFCNNKCKEKFEKDPEKVLEKYNKQ